MFQTLKLTFSGKCLHPNALKVLTVNPDLSFILLGNSGQQEPEIYADVIRANPTRIKAAYIRDVSSETRRNESVRALIQAATDHNVPMMLVTDIVAAAALGLIDPDALPGFRADRQADNQ